MPARAFIGSQRFLLLGPAFEHDLHAHHALQLCVALDPRAEIALRSDAAQPFRRAPGFVVPADCPHQFEAGDALCALVYLDAEDAAARPHAGRLPAPLHVAPHVLSELRDLCERGGSSVQVERACQQLLGADVSEASRPLHPYVQAAVAAIRASLDGRIRLEQLASEVGTSASWLSHRFRAETGLPLRSYVRWQRMWRALWRLAQGQSLTQAAHTSGFADSAHLSRSFRSMFGITPSTLVAQRSSMNIQFLE